MLEFLNLCWELELTIAPEDVVVVYFVAGPTTVVNWDTERRMAAL